MAYKRPLPRDLEPQWHDLRERSEQLRRELTRFLDDCDRFLRQCRLTCLTHKEAVADFLEQRPGRVFGSRQIQKALEAEGMFFSHRYTVSADAHTPARRQPSRPGQSRAMDHPQRRRVRFEQGLNYAWN